MVARNQPMPERMTPKNWAQFQHYRDRSPPWIKLHRSILDDFDFMALAVAGRALAPLIWLLASESPDGFVDCNVKRLAWRLRLDVKEVESGLRSLFESGYLIPEQGASNVLADACNSHTTAISETEGETEGETESERASARVDAAGRRKAKQPAKKPDEVSQRVWDDWLTHRKALVKDVPSETALDGFRRESAAAGISLEEALSISITQGWRGFRADWYANTVRAGGGSRNGTVVPKSLPVGSYTKPGDDPVQSW